MKKIILITITVFSTSMAMAQYNFAIGLRSGGTSGITVKKNYQTTSVEGIIGFWHNGLSITGLWEKHGIVFTKPGFQWFYGVGGHLAFYGDNFEGKKGPGWYKHPHHVNDGDFGLGIDGILGFEYKITSVPIAFDISLKPFIEIANEGGIVFSPDPGFGIKVAF